jgi:pimeloyl-ACP methyl ester carboxylesterase
VAVLSSFAPRSAKGLAWFAGSCKWNLKEFKALEEGDTQLWKFLEDAIAGMRKIENGAQLRAGDMEDAYCQADRDALFGPHLEYEVQSYAKVVRSGPVGWFDDDKAIWGDWGFDLAQIDVPVAIWQGQDDRIVPAAHAEWLVRNVPGARLHLLPGEGHISYFDRHYGAILDELLALG